MSPRRSKPFIAWIVAAGAVLSAIACHQAGTVATNEGSIRAITPTTAPMTQAHFRALNLPELENAHVVTDKVISGAQPEGDASFAALQKLGIKTIISVDGALPDVETAHKYGLRYVHLPIKYEGVTPDEGRAIAKAIDELPGPIYLHCHHGKHRSAAATAVACVYNGSLAPEQAEEVLKTFGTGANYKGLWKAARDARPLLPEALAQVHNNYVERARIDDLSRHMVDVDFHWDNVKLTQKSGWQAPAEHPDLDPAHEVLQVEEHLRESARLQEMSARPADFKQKLTAAEASTRTLRELLEAGNVDPKATNDAAKTVAQSCTSCHAAYRD
jgi:protein tyrosine phosphatase (PTP) superfamily phosphohydrolase (DUF442 family)